MKSKIFSSNFVYASSYTSLLGLVFFLLVACGTTESSPLLPTSTATAVETPTATPSAIPTTAQATPTAEQPPTPTVALTPAFTRPSELGKTAFRYLDDIVEKLGTRESATEQEKAAADYLETIFQDLGYSTEQQLLTVNLFSQDSGLTLITPETSKVDSYPLSRSMEGDITGTLVDVGLGMDEITPDSGLAGNVAFIQRGIITFQEKVFRAASVGAIAAIIYNNESGGFRGAFSNPSSIPAVSISEEDGERIKKLIGQGQVQARVLVRREDKATRNVIAEMPGSGKGVVVLGGHFDTVPSVQGANDNGSGIAVLLTIAQELSQRSFPFTLRFIAFGSEELGLFGSQFYVSSLSDEERKAIIAMLNFDSVGTGNRLNIIGDQRLVDITLDLARENSIEARDLQEFRFGTSDHASFQAAGIPAIFFSTDDLSRIHTPQDTLEFIQEERLQEVAELGMRLVNKLVTDQR